LGLAFKLMKGRGKEKGGREKQPDGKGARETGVWWRGHRLAYRKGVGRGLKLTSINLH